MKISKVTKTEAGTGEITMEYAERTFKELLAFQGYGFCLGYDVPVTEMERGEIMLGQLHVGDSVLAPGDEGGERWEKVRNILPQGEKELFKIEFENGRTLHATLDHPLLCDDGVLRGADEIMRMRVDEKIVCKVMFRNGPARIMSVEYMGMFPVMDISISGKSHLFYANECIVHNCKAHAVSYSVYSAVQMWMQQHYLLQYMCVLLTHIDRAKEKKGHLILNERVAYCIRQGISIHYPDVNISGDRWEIEAGALRAPLKNIKGFSDRDVSLIQECRPYSGLKDFLDKTGYKYRKFEALLFAHAFDCWGSIEDLYNWYYNHYYDEGGKKTKAPAMDDLFALDDDASQSSCSEVIRHFTKEELEEASLDMNGFVILDNLLIKYSGYYGAPVSRYIADFNKTNVIYKLSDIKSTPLDEAKRDRGVTKWTLAQVKSVTHIKTKNGNHISKVVVSDGITLLEIVFFSSVVPKIFERGNVLLFPINISFYELRGELSFKYNGFEGDRYDVLILEKGERK